MSEGHEAINILRLLVFKNGDNERRERIIELANDIVATNRNFSLLFNFKVYPCI